MAEMDKLIIDVDTRSKSAADSLGDLISKLEKLSASTDGAAKNLKTIASSVNSLRNAFNKLNQLDFDKVDQSIKRLNSSLSSMKSSVKSFSDTTSQIKTMTSALNSLNRAMVKLSKNQTPKGLDLSKMTLNVNQYQKTANAMSNVSVGAMGGVNMLANAYMIRQAANALKYLITESNDYIETMNLFNVVMGENTKTAYDFIDSLQTIGVDMEEAMRFQASFYDIGKSLGMSTKNAYTLSEQFTKLSYDYASLYNLPVEEAFQKLQAAAVGTTEPIRRLGKDISIAKLEEIALSLGIQENVRNMTQSEKATLRFIAVMQQSTSAMNDMERTINSPANAFRVLRAQLTSLAREVGNLLLPILGAVLPYLIAIAKFLRGIVQDIASFLGVKLFEIDLSGLGTSMGVADDYSSNIADNLDNGAKSAKKIKDYMLGIDELNVLNKDTGNVGTDTGAAGIGAGGDLGLDLEKFGYEQLLKNVNSQADNILKTFNKWKPVLLTISGILGGLWVIGKITQFIRALKGVQSTSAILTGTQGLKGLADSFFDLAGSGGAIGTLSTAFVGLGDKVLTFLGYTTGSVTIAGLTGFGVVLAGIAAAAGAVYIAMQPSIGQLEEFAIASEETRSKLEPVVDTWKDLEKQITKIDLKNKVISDNDIESIVGKTKEMVDAVLNEVDADRNESLKDIELLKGAKGISPETYQKMITDTNKYYDGIKANTEGAEQEINEILSRASKEKRTLKEDEVARIKELEEQIRDNAVTTMTKSEEEQITIMYRLKHNKNALQLESASEMLQSAKKNYDNQVSEAEDWRARMLMQLDQRFGDEATMSNAEYKKQYEAIEAAYQDQIDSAESKYSTINEKVKEGLGTQYRYIDQETGKIKTNWQKFLSDISTQWDTTWKGLKTWFQSTIDNLVKWWDGIMTEWDKWKKKFSKGWNDFWGGIGNWWEGSKLNPGNWFGTQSRFAFAVDYGIGSVQTPTLAAYAGGGFVPSKANFISPDMWTAGEAGKELIGSYQGRTTVMPLENTSFVSAMYDAIYQATRDAYGENEMTIIVQPKVELDSKDISKGQEEYKYKSGGSLIKKK